MLAWLARGVRDAAARTTADPLHATRFNLCRGSPPLFEPALLPSLLQGPAPPSVPLMAVRPLVAGTSSGTSVEGEEGSEEMITFPKMELTPQMQRELDSASAPTFLNGLNDPGEGDGGAGKQMASINDARQSAAAAAEAAADEDSYEDSYEQSFE